MSALRKVLIRVSSEMTSDVYLARSWPDDDRDDNGLIELYEVPIYKVFLEGTDADGNDVKEVWTALRFMPFWNDPKNPSKGSSKRGWKDSGLKQVEHKPVPKYKEHYDVHNRPSNFTGAIVVQGFFYIHAGPENITESGWGAAGCVEVIGSFNDFRRDILGMAGSTESDIQVGMTALVKAQKLYVQYDLAQPPDFKSHFKGEVVRTW